MNAFSVANVSSSNQKDILDEWEIAVQLISFSMRPILLACPNPMDRSTDFSFAGINLSMDEVMKLLEISKGSASQGLRALRQLGAVSSVFEPGDRKREVCC